MSAVLLAALLGASAPAQPDSVLAACETARVVAARVLGLTMRLEPDVEVAADFTLPGGVVARGCRVTAHADDDRIAAPVDDLREALETQGWVAPPMYQADGPNGSVVGMIAGPAFCVVEGSWDGGDDSDTTYVPTPGYDLEVRCHRRDGARAPADLLVPEGEYPASEMPAAPAGAWWVLDARDASAVLVELAVEVAAIPDACVEQSPGARSVRTVRAPGAAWPLVLLRGIPALSAGPVRTVFSHPASAGDTVTVMWDGAPLVVRRVPEGDGFRVETVVSGVTHVLHREAWQDGGVFAVRWIGDLDRDGRADLLLDVSHKYSVHTTRLYLSGAGGASGPPAEVARRTRVAC